MRGWLSINGRILHTAIPLKQDSLRILDKMKKGFSVMGNSSIHPKSMLKLEPKC